MRVSPHNITGNRLKSKEEMGSRKHLDIPSLSLTYPFLPSVT